MDSLTTLISINVHSISLTYIEFADLLSCSRQKYQRAAANNSMQKHRREYRQS